MQKRTNKRDRQKTWPTLILILIFLLGLSLLLYPTLSDYWNSFHQSRAIASYAEAVAEMDNELYQAMLADAAAYNAKLTQRGTKWHLSDGELAEYEDLLRVSDRGVMGHIEIPAINVSLPIYHGTSDSVLQEGVGHLEGSSLPVGGESTHCVISGHRGLPSARLFTDLDELREGDTFMLCVLNETLTYEVDQILIVEPTDLSALNIVAGEDYCTLVTCTPYGVNTHRLLVRGHRIETENVSTIRVTGDAVQLESTLIAPLVAAPILLVLLVLLLFKTRRRKN